MSAPELHVSPEPTAEEAAAITAALLALTPTAVEEAAPEPPRWRFSGRWWSKPVSARRDRP